MSGEIDLRQTPRLSTRYSALLGTFHNAAVRDLLWLLSSPGLLRTGAAQIPQALPEVAPEQWAAIAGWLRTLDAQPGRLHAWLAASSQKRLGRYAEQLLEFFLGEGMMGRLIAANLPLRRARQTLGECDFLLEAHDGTRLHWELAVKYYLFVDEPFPDSTEPGPPPRLTGDKACPAEDKALSSDNHAALARYVGPNLLDRFDMKLTRMVEHQLPLSARPEFRARVAGGPWQAELFLRGWLFYPLAPQRMAACRIPDLLNPQHLRGWWASVDDWQRWHAALGVQAWRILPRLEWMAQRRFDALAARDAALLDSAAMQAWLAAHFDTAAVAAVQTDAGPDKKSGTRPAGPCLLVGLTRSGDAWVECTRGFVVDEEWFARARVYATSRQRESV